ncbi:glycosyltransferase family 4 protein [Insolitispirillum peregrinum]|uniref:glycosyltransferase family 4 protein n=1 Tax=Insolitispirillum peregrinum TaxID=80876 RepID=UPI0036072DA4
MSKRPLLLFVVTEDWYFCSHRLPMARAARAAGFDVAVATRVNRHGATIEAEGFRLFPLRELHRQGKNPLQELKAIAELWALYRRERPDLVHHVAMKPVLYGSLAARLAGVGNVVNAMAGLGFVFTARSLKARILKPVISAAFRFLLRRAGSVLLVQNKDDRQHFLDAGLVPAQAVTLIPGSGVDISAFTPTPEPPGTPVALFVGRLLWDKGLGELVAAARLVRDSGVPLRVQIAGDRDPANPACIPETVLAGWAEEGVVEFLGRRNDIATLWAGAHIAVLPSYREGMPKSLLEAAACGRPLISTNVPGCRALVQDGENGLLVPARDARALAQALQRLADDPDLRREMGAVARQQAETIYSEQAVGAAVVALYSGLLKGERG